MCLSTYWQWSRKLPVSPDAWWEIYGFLLRIFILTLCEGSFLINIPRFLLRIRLMYNLFNSRSISKVDSVMALLSLVLFFLLFISLLLSFFIFRRMGSHQMWLRRKKLLDYFSLEILRLSFFHLIFFSLLLIVPLLFFILVGGCFLHYLIQRNLPRSYYFLKMSNINYHTHPPLFQPISIKFRLYR